MGKESKEMFLLNITSISALPLFTVLHRVSISPSRWKFI
jgi:hypothetical protein